MVTSRKRNFNSTKGEMMDSEKRIVSFRKQDERKKEFVIQREIFSWIKTIGGTLIIFYLLTRFVFRTVEVQGHSMNPTLNNGERIFVWQLFYSPDFLDVIVLEHTDGNLHVKRIIGIPGDRIDYINGEMIINGDLVYESYILPEPSLNGFTFERLCGIRNGDSSCEAIPEGYFLVLGDNRNRSGDSREYGLVHESQIMGRVALRFFPFNDFGIVE